MFLIPPFLPREAATEAGVFRFFAEVHPRRVIALGGAETIGGLGHVVPQVLWRFQDAADEGEPRSPASDEQPS